jgi:hypothetical protein
MQLSDIYTEDELQLFRRIEDGTATLEEITEFCDMMVGYLANGLHYGGVFPWDTIAAAEAATGRNLEAEAMKQLI